MSSVERYEPATPAAPAPWGQQASQATAIEQSRAIAEVQAAVLVAQQRPRDEDAAVAAMRRSCTRRSLAERATYSYNRGGQTVTGPSITLARELARCWGNVQYGVNELRRDDVQGESEMQAWAWDLESNARSSQTFIVPHRRDARGGQQRITSLRDIYENNTNNASRRLREAIFAVLPQWYTEEALDLCSQTLTQGDGKPIEQRRQDALRAFENQGITQQQLEQKIGCPVTAWTGHDLAQLEVLYRSLSRGEITVEEAFPTQVTANDLIGP